MYLYVYISLKSFCSVRCTHSEWLYTFIVFRCMGACANVALYTGKCLSGLQMTLLAGRELFVAVMVFNLFRLHLHGCRRIRCTCNAVHTKWISSSSESVDWRCLHEMLYTGRARQIFDWLWWTLIEMSEFRCCSLHISGSRESVRGTADGL